MRKRLDCFANLGVFLLVFSLVFTFQSEAEIEPGSAIGIWLLNESSGVTH